MSGNRTTRVLAAAVAVQFVVVAVLAGIIWQGRKNAPPPIDHAVAVPTENSRSAPAVATDPALVAAPRIGAGSSSTVAVGVNNTPTFPSTRPAPVGVQGAGVAIGTPVQVPVTAVSGANSRGGTTAVEVVPATADGIAANRRNGGSPSAVAGGFGVAAGTAFAPMSGGGGSGGASAGGSASGEAAGRSFGGDERALGSGAEFAKIELPEGTSSVPAALEEIDPDIAADPAKAQQLREIQTEFVENIGGVNRDPTDPAYAAAWRSAQWLADQRYRSLYGHTAFLRQQERAAAALSRENSGQ